MASIVFDASVILAHINSEPGSERAEALFGEALISAVNVAEIVSKLVERGASLGLIRAALSRYGLQIAVFDADLAERAGALRAKTKPFGLSLGDRACLALGERFALPVLTADRAWKDLNLSIEVRLLR
ncbi:MAG: PIN domain-containing protein [Rhodomicrobium sp.]